MTHNFISLRNFDHYQETSKNNIVFLDSNDVGNCKQQVTPELALYIKDYYSISDKAYKSRKYWNYQLPSLYSILV